MRLLLFQRKPKPEKPNPIVEIIWAGHSLANYLLTPGGQLSECVCGSRMSDPTDPALHRRCCPVARFYAAVRAAKEDIQAP